MRITGGRLKGRIITCPVGIIRPAMDKMRESFFSVLGELDGKSFLDLFSGSGIIALEAASRGAESVTLCEKDKLKIDTLLKNVSLSEDKLGKKIECKFMAVELFLKRCKDQYDIIFCDPPFPYKYHEDIIKIVSDKALLKADGVLLIHRPKERRISSTVGKLIKNDTRNYGHSILDFYTHSSQEVVYDN